MKKIMLLVLALVLCLSLCACGQSEAAKQVDEMILGIGTVTLESESAVKSAESAYDALTQEQKGELANYSVLVTARTALDALLEEKAEADRVAALQAQAADVDDRIGAIGQVSLDKADVIAEARAAYDALDEEARSYVTGFANLEKAERELSAAQADIVVALIDDIGTVSLESGDAIKAAEAEYNAQTEVVKGLVGNADVLAAARAEYNTQLANFAEPYLGKLKLEEDRVRGMKFYYASGFPYYENYGYWGADVRSFVLPYMGVQGNNVWLRLVCDYTADDWVFFEKITFAVDDQRFYRLYNYNDVVRDNAYGDIWEYVDIEVDDDEIELLRAIANSDVTIVRFEGDTYWDDVEIKASDKKAITEMLLVYEYMLSRK